MDSYQQKIKVINTIIDSLPKQYLDMMIEKAEQVKKLSSYGDQIKEHIRKQVSKSLEQQSLEDDFPNNPKEQTQWKNDMRSMVAMLHNVQIDVYQFNRPYITIGYMIYIDGKKCFLIDPEAGIEITQQSYNKVFCEKYNLTGHACDNKFFIKAVCDVLDVE